MPKKEVPACEALYPVPVILVSCYDRASQKNNILTIAWCGVAASNPPTLSISVRPSRYSHAIIKATGDFVVNIPTLDILKEVDLCGIASGKTTDKFKSCGFHPQKASKVSSCLIKECPVNIECVLKGEVSLGSHDMFLGRVVAVHVDEHLLEREGNIDYEKARPIVYNQGQYWNLGKVVGSYGFSRNR